MTLAAVVLAAGRGQRMKSALPKMLHPIAGRPLVFYAVRAAFEAGAGRVVVVTGGDGREAIETFLRAQFGERVVPVLQDPPRGTGDAARIALAHVDGERVLVLCGDTPLLRAEHLAVLLDDVSDSAPLAVLTAVVDDPTGYGRALRDAAGRFTEIREHRDLRTDAERAVREINAGIYAARTEVLRSALSQIEPNNAQGELYLTDTVAVVARSATVVGRIGHGDALVGVNDRAQLARAEDLMFRRIAERHAAAGVSVHGDARIDDGVAVGHDAVLESGVRVRGASSVAERARIDVGAVITDSSIGEGAKILPYSVISESQVGPGAQIGPFAHLRPGSQIDEGAHIGNFVETKKTRVRKGAKANHLAYLGDGDIGEGANVGAGTIFCNYDGFQKHRTVIGARAFIGSDSQLVAPVTIGEGAYVATGTTVTRDVPADALAIGRVKQETKLGYASRLRGRLEASAKKGK